MPKAAGIWTHYEYPDVCEQAHLAANLLPNRFSRKSKKNNIRKLTGTKREQTDFGKRATIHMECSPLKRNGLCETPVREGSKDAVFRVIVILVSRQSSPSLFLPFHMSEKL